ncbi:MAG: hypothetical protein PHE61_00705 [Candidatus Omnitrophica bacterium]|nr:hypothetical protein [Candidatus Omnitrophota bacterium]
MRKFNCCLVVVLFYAVFFSGCQTEDAASKVIAPVAKPVVDTTDDVLQTRTLQSESGAGPKAVIFPNEKSDERDDAGDHGTKQFKLQF